MSHQRQDSHPYMSKAQLNEYLSSLRNSSQPRPEPKQPSIEQNPDARGSTPLVRALKERYGSGNTTAGYVDVGLSKGRESPTKRALPPVPGKSENSTGWKVGGGRGNSLEGRREIIVKPIKKGLIFKRTIKFNNIKLLFIK